MNPPRRRIEYWSSICFQKLSKLAFPKDKLHCLGTVANMEKTIKKPALYQLGLRGDPLVNDEPCKDPQLIGKPNGLDIV